MQRYLYKLKIDFVAVIPIRDVRYRAMYSNIEDRTLHAYCTLAWSADEAHTVLVVIYAIRLVYEGHARIRGLVRTEPLYRL